MPSCTDYYTTHIYSSQEIDEIIAKIYPISPYHKYVTIRYPTFSKNYPDKQQNELVELITAEWNTLSIDEKLQYKFE